MEIWRVSAFCLLVIATLSSTNAQSGTNQSQPEDTSPPPSEMTFTTEGSMMMMMNSSSITTVSEEIGTSSATVPGANDQAVPIGNGSQPPLHVELSSMPPPDSSSQSTNQSDSAMSTTPEVVKSDSTTTEPTTERTTVPEMKTSPWVPGKFPPPGVGSENDESKNTGSGLPGTGSTIDLNVPNNDANLNKSHYDIFQAHQPAIADETSTTSGALSGMDATMGFSKEVGMDNSAKSNRQQQEKDNGVTRGSGCWAVILSAAIILSFAF